jgi:hypothetical protein
MTRSPSPGSRGIPGSLGAPEAQLTQVARATLRDVVRRLLGDETARVGSWRAEELPVMWPSPLRAGLYRLRGTATVAAAPGAARPWSVVLKVATCPLEGTSGAQEGDWRYWRREERLVRSGLLDGLPPGFAVPRAYRIEERPDGRVWLWTEDLGEAPRGRWPPARLALTARHLGRFNGLSLEGSGPRPLPDAPWLGRDWLRQWLARVGRFERGAGPLFADAAAWAHPLVRRVFPTPVRERVTRLWEEREALLAGLDRLPRTLCHGDFWPPNLFPRAGPDGRPETAAIDWELAHVGPVGTDLGQYLVASLYDLRTDCLEREAYQAYADAALEQYVLGLRDAARSAVPAAAGDGGRLARLARFGCAAHAALHWGWVYVDWAVRAIVDPERRARVEADSGLPMEEVARHRAAAVYATLDLADRARALLPALP